jgi:hypothetical protein
MYILMYNIKQTVEVSHVHFNVQHYTDSGGIYVHCNVQKYTGIGGFFCSL